MTTEERICARCGRPVEENAERYELFERMHWLCFHLEFEHEGDPDVACGDPGCPWWHIAVYRRALESLGHDPGAVLDRAIHERWGGG